ncbi:hypothetical protein [Lentibacillus salicampi]|uniref:Uncharacterized protein n=1 Tax=Lentibacillus salicampi TaxID=175306 RepID=A0A4Y9ADW2_9BACI|nr:hypothetical protein [Lentibacillus salicampi]TFJ94078.1 hypothetical protein E4U82_04495 [Lentibacillus salicampi]
MEFILVILGIVAALSGLFKDNSDSDSPIPKRRNNPPRPTPTPSGGGGSSSSTWERQNESGSQPSASSIEEQEYEQRKQLAERMNTMPYQSQEPELEHDATIRYDPRKSENGLAVEQEKLKRSMKRSLTRSGVINGVMMSEVLGQPRAVKPYRSIIAQRKNRN